MLSTQTTGQVTTLACHFLLPHVASPCSGKRAKATSLQVGDRGIPLIFGYL